MTDNQIETAAGRDYRNTVFLPSTPFPMRGDLPKKEPGMLARWEAIGLWGALRERSKGRDPFILHDGPPYANGNLHIGTALNKILKDVVNRARQMGGYDANYIPGWDCHGLPIEWKIEEQYRAAKKDKDAVPVLDFRAECRAYAQHWMGVQEQEFRRLGVLGDWPNRYATMDLPSEAAIFGEIGRFLMNGALYRGLRPVMWSPVEKTALAEAEIEYHDHTSTTITVRFPIVQCPIAALAGAAILIWTTTPWTMPGNRAIALGEDIDYAVVRIDSTREGALARPGERVLVALALLPQLCEAAGVETHHLLHVHKGRELLGTVCAHPMRGRGYDHDVTVYSADYVTTEAGTGFVHIAPGHGEEDFELGRQHAIEVPDTVGEDGTFNAWVPHFAGQHVYKVADAICAALADAGGLVARGKLVHSYPHSWRSKAPLIFRATPQWFIRMDGPEEIRRKSLDAIAATHFVPDQGRNRIGSMVASRPDWCISRQRAWGVPIAVFVERATGQPLRDQAVVDRIAAAFATEGADAWYSSPAERFLGEGRDPAAYEQVFDIVDVWFESGSTHAFVLEKRGLPWPADLYLEGSDQHRGWFHSSLLESVGTRGVAPFKAVLTHGFTLDEQGRKMSKSLGNTIAPQQVWDQYGADILRLWVMNTEFTEDQRIGTEILKQTAELYRRLRNTLRWLLGGLNGFTEAERIDPADMPELERWVLHRLAELDARVRQAVQDYDWTGVYPAIHTFCAADLSAFYFDIRKDALYCDRPDSLRRRACRTVLDILHRTLCTWLAPALVFTAEEAWAARFGDNTGSEARGANENTGSEARGAHESVHLQDFHAVPVQWRDDALGAKWDTLRDLRRLATAELEAMRAEKRIGSSNQAVVTLALPDAQATLLSPEAWADILIVAGATVERAPVAAARATLAPGTKCDRCWKVLPEVGRSAAHPTLCARCVDAVESGLICHGA